MSTPGDAGRPRWIVLTPSVDDAAWRGAIAEAAARAGLRSIDASGPHVDLSDRSCVYVTDDASVALAAQGSEIVAIMPEPETAPEAVAEKYETPAPHDVMQASLLLARAAAIAPQHPIVTATDLSRRPAMLRLFGELDVKPPPSVAEVSRHPAVAAAFSVYRHGGSSGVGETPWSERLFHYDEKAARNWAAPGHLDVTGRPRILVYGPYLALPKGRWRVRARFAADDAASRHEFRLDWGTPTDFTSLPVNLSKGGVYEGELDHVWSQSEAAELRLLLMEGAFEGRLHFLGATILPAT